MKRDISLSGLIGFAFVSLAGTLLHFLYELTGKSILVSPISGVNESTWEHMKLLFFPLFIFALIQHMTLKERQNFWCIKLIGITSGLILIPVLFYTYNGAFGKSPDWLNITIFFISAAASFLIETRLLKKSSIRCRYPWIAFGVITLIGILFVVFTYITPELPLFKDPLTGTYGIQKIPSYI